VATTADIKDEALRERLGAAERLLDADQFRAAVERCAETYLLILRQHPALAQQARELSAAGLAPPGGGRPAIGGPTPVWPIGVGLCIAFDGDGAPHTTLEKERFSFSEAATCFEFVLDLATRAERP